MRETVFYEAWSSFMMNELLSEVLQYTDQKCIAIHQLFSNKTEQLNLCDLIYWGVLLTFVISFSDNSLFNLHSSQSEPVVGAASSTLGLQCRRWESHHFTRCSTLTKQCQWQQRLSLLTHSRLGVSQYSLDANVSVMRGNSGIVAQPRVGALLLPGICPCAGTQTSEAERQFIRKLWKCDATKTSPGHGHGQILYRLLH